MIYNLLFPTKPSGKKASLLLLSIRIIFGILLMTHGIQKWTHFSDLTTTFPDPLGIGSYLSLCLAIFAELFCSMGFILGILYRFALIPMIFTMGVVVFVVSAEKPFSAKELAFVYFVVFIAMYIAGPGKYAIDRWFIGLKKKHSGT